MKNLVGSVAVTFGIISLNSGAVLIGADALGVAFFALSMGR